ncbi:NlpC/P60 family protein [Actinoplanes regularis]|uniref:NlpC/P60 family protein n=1 Tax=Actinoplanes regularis TaxID=52697 RepID=A0A239KJ18_9ACTN|nr:hypothetical protein Are01nite_89710 [Actinoplanes regularis]SNT17134.1 NlpC/P60 family protein [Actinoplanes regularis]
MQQSYRAAGITIPRITTDQINAGITVPSAAQLLPGDLIFLPGSLGTRAYPHHVGMYLGSGLIINAPKTGDVVKIANSRATGAGTIERRFRDLHQAATEGNKSIQAKRSV